MSLSTPPPHPPASASSVLATGLPAPRLWRSRSNKRVAGVLGGLAEKWGVQATFLRVLFATLLVFSAGFPGLLIYLCLWAITRPADPVVPGTSGRSGTGGTGR